MKLERPGNVKFLRLFLFLRVSRPGSKVSISYRVRGPGADTCVAERVLLERVYQLVFLIPQLNTTCKATGYVTSGGKCQSVLKKPREPNVQFLEPALTCNKEYKYPVTSDNINSYFLKSYRNYTLRIVCETQ